jgi:tRNA nucleotidyltransferase (CCA-adding enzyme)
MEVFLVGGAVRDELLGRPVRERDWVVVGSSPAELEARGFRRVGRDFPVFLHPETGEEYALARTERKTGPGHTGFVVHAGPEVTLEEDLLRRDLTVNAMARREDGVLVDPYGGQRDLARRLLRHVSPAFREDPLRVFRVARFAAQLEAFEVAPETLALMGQMARDGALDELSAERVWAELAKALAAPAPSRFFAVLAAADSLNPWFAELAGRTVAPPPSLTEPTERYAAIAGVLEPAAAEALGRRLKCPRAHQRLAMLIASHRHSLVAYRTVPVAMLYAALVSARAFKPRGDLPQVLRVAGALSGEDVSPLLALVHRCSQAVDVADLRARGLEGAALGAALDAERQACLARERRN